MSTRSHLRALGIAPSSRGFGYAVLDGTALIDWGIRVVGGDKNAQCLMKVEPLVTHYEPEVLVLEDFAQSRRCLRIRLLIQQIVDLAPKYNVGVKLITRAQLYRLFFKDGQATKETLAALLATQFPYELGIRLPPKRKTWMNEDPRMALFDAVAFGLTACEAT